MMEMHAAFIFIIRQLRVHHVPPPPNLPGLQSSCHDVKMLKTRQNKRVNIFWQVSKMLLHWGEYILLDVLECSINLLQTECKGRTGKYWSEVVAAALGPYRNDRGLIFPSTARAC